MRLSDLILEVRSWSRKEKIELCCIISQNLTIAIRSIISYTDNTEQERLEAIRWINEFHHRINNLRFKIERVIDGTDKIGQLEEHAIFYSKQDEIAKNEISEVLKHSHKSMIDKIEKRKNFGLEESIFDLINKENFRKKIGMYITEKKITTLKGFIDGYIYAIDCMEIQLKETEPKFEKFGSWVADYFNYYEATAGWKNIILKECNGDERAAVDKFFELYDKFEKNKKLK